MVASLLTAGCLLNRRRPADIVLANNLADSSPDRVAENGGWNWREMRFLFWTMRVPDNAKFRMNLTSRFLAMFPFLMEVWYWLLTYVFYWQRSTESLADYRYWVYQIARACQALTMGDSTRELSERHARQIIAIERFFHIDIELGLQRIVMNHQWLLTFFNKYVCFASSLSLTVSSLNHYPL